jgi:hypothetical protein
MLCRASSRGARPDTPANASRVLGMNHPFVFTHNLGWLRDDGGAGDYNKAAIGSP